MRFSFLGKSMLSVFSVLVLLLSGAVTSVVAAAPAQAALVFPVPPPKVRKAAGNMIEANVMSTTARAPVGTRPGIDVELLERVTVEGKTVWRSLFGKPTYRFWQVNKGGEAEISLNHVTGDQVMARARWVITQTRTRSVARGKWVNGPPTVVKAAPVLLKGTTIPRGCAHQVVPFKSHRGLEAATGYVIMDCPGARSHRVDGLQVSTYRCNLPHAGGVLPCGGWHKVAERTRVLPAITATRVTGKPWSTRALVVEVTIDTDYDVGNVRHRLAAQIDYEQLPHPPLIRARLRYNASADSYLRGDWGR